MPQKPIDYALIDMAWGFYVETPSPAAVQRRCNAAGYTIHRNTISRWINNGIPSADIEAFKSRLQRIRQAAELLEASKKQPPGEPAPSLQVELVQAQTPAEHRRTTDLVDAATAHYALARLEDWRAEIDRTLQIAKMANDLVLECVMGADPEDHIAVKNATVALKNSISAMRGAVESQAVINGQLGGGDDDDVRDRWVQENFKGWTAAEHRAFRDHGIWPERLGPAPDFILSGGSDPDEGDD